MTNTLISNKTSIENALAYVRSFDGKTPTPMLDVAVNDLVEKIITLPPEHLRLVSPELRQAVRTAISDTESRREAEWAKKIFMSEKPSVTLQQFPYLKYYEQTISREISLLDASGLELNASHRMLAIGSGPLPMTAILFHKRRGVTVDQSDIDESALELGRHVSQSLGLPGDYLLGAGDSMAPVRQYDVIFIAVLAGDSHEEKQAIVANLLPCLKPNGRLLMRSSRGVRSIIYPSIDADKLAGVRLLAEEHPSNYVTNSLLVFERTK